MNESSSTFFSHLPYDTLTWLWWVLVVFLAVWWRRWRGMVFGHLTVAASILMLNLRWIHAAMSAPGWKGTPNMDRYFVVGLIVHMALINGILLPLSLLGLLLGSRKTTPPAIKVPET